MRQFQVTADGKLRVNLADITFLPRDLFRTERIRFCSLFYRKDYPGSFLACQASPRQCGVTRVGIENGVHMQKVPSEISP